MEDLFAAGGIGAVLRELQPSSLGSDRRRRDRRRALARPPARSTARWCDRWPEPFGSRRGPCRAVGSLGRRGDLQRSAPTQSCSRRRAARSCYLARDLSAASMTRARRDADDFMCCSMPAAVAVGMPEAATCRSRQAARAGGQDMVRISDARMSGNRLWPIVLHVTPDRHPGGRSPRSERRSYSLSVNTPHRPLGRAGGLARRRHASRIPERGYARLYRREILAGRPRLRFSISCAHPIVDAAPEPQATAASLPERARALLDVWFGRRGSVRRSAARSGSEHAGARRHAAPAVPRRITSAPPRARWPIGKRAGQPRSPGPAARQVRQHLSAPRRRLRPTAGRAVADRAMAKGFDMLVPRRGGCSSTCRLHHSETSRQQRATAVVASLPDRRDPERGGNRRYGFPTSMSSSALPLPASHAILAAIDARGNRLPRPVEPESLQNRRAGAAKRNPPAAERMAGCATLHPPYYPVIGVRLCERTKNIHISG